MSGTAFNFPNLEGSNVLLVGGMGFVGSNLAHRMIRMGAKVTIVDAMLEPYGGNLYNLKGIEKQTTFIRGDARDDDLMKQTVKDKNFIFTLFAQVSHLLSMTDPMLDIDINCKGNMTVLEAVRKYNDSAKVLYGGTRGSTGDAKYLPVDENHPDEPPDINGINKWAAEKYHLIYNKVYGLKTTSLRIGNTYGERHQMKHGHYGVLNYFIRRAMMGEPIQIYGDGEQTRDYTYVDDLVDAFLLMMGSKEVLGKMYLIGGGQMISFKTMVDTVVETVGKGKVEHVPFPDSQRKAIDVRKFFVTTERLRSATGWTPKTPLSEGMKKTVAFYRDHLKEYI